jgi:hypothetical protein
MAGVAGVVGVADEEEEEEEEREIKSAEVCDARESASEKYPFRTHVSMRTGISKTSLTFSCCSRTTLAFFLSLKITSVSVFHAPTLRSSAGRLSPTNASSEPESDASEALSEVVAVCRDKNVGYEEWVSAVSDDVRWCACV